MKPESNQHTLSIYCKDCKQLDRHKCVQFNQSLRSHRVKLVNWYVKCQECLGIGVPRP